MTNEVVKFELSAPDFVRRFTQEDMLSSGIRMGLSVVGPVGSILGEFLTQFVPNQRIDRLQEFVEHLHSRFIGLEEDFRARLQHSAAYAALAEQTTVAAVQTASDERRRDLAELLRTGLSKSDVDLAEHESLLRLRERMNDPQVLILMRHANFRGTIGDADAAVFVQKHDAVFGTRPPDSGSSDEERRRWVMYSHYEEGLISLGLLRDTEGVAKSGHRRKVAATALGRILLEAIGRSAGPKAE